MCMWGALRIRVRLVKPSAPLWLLILRLPTALTKEPLSGFFLNLTVLYLGRGQIACKFHTMAKSIIVESLV